MRVGNEMGTFGCSEGSFNAQNKPLPKPQASLLRSTLTWAHPFFPLGQGTRTTGLHTVSLSQSTVDSAVLRADAVPPGPLAVQSHLESSEESPA